MIPVQKSIPQNGDIPATRSTTLRQTETKRVLDALRDDRLLLYFQPIVRSNSQDFIAFYEGLARIKMPDGTVISAGQFIPFIENTTLGAALDRKTLSLAFSALTDHPDIRLSVNMTVQSMSDPDWLYLLEHAKNTVCERLILEITENDAMVDAELTTAFMQRARQKGISFALDDFGTGSTAFRYFKDFKFDIVKIDGLFIRDLPLDKANRVLVKALVDISQHFEMFTVAEFIETEAEASVASDLGVDCLQGYLIGQPAKAMLQPRISSSVRRRITG